jgi:hypothetical protein
VFKTRFWISSLKVENQNRKEKKAKEWLTCCLGRKSLVGPTPFLILPPHSPPPCCSLTVIRGPPLNQRHVHALCHRFTEIWGRSTKWFSHLELLRLNRFVTNQIPRSSYKHPWGIYGGTRSPLSSIGCGGVKSPSTQEIHRSQAMGDRRGREWEVITIEDGVVARHPIGPWWVATRNHWASHTLTVASRA